MTDVFAPEYVRELAERLGASGPLGDATASLALGQVVTDGTNERAWTIRLGGGVPPSVEDGVDSADVVLVEDAATARAIAAGEPMAELLSSGRVRVRGSAEALVRNTDLLAALAAALGGAGGS